MFKESTGGVRIRKKRLLTACIALFVGILFGTGVLLFANAQTQKREAAATAEQRRLEAMEAAIEAALAKGNSAVQTEGEVFRILCDRTAAPYLSEASADGEFGRLIRNRNTYFELENRVTLSVAVSDDLYTVAVKDALSGDNTYTLYAADAANTLCKLLAAGLLGDVSPLLASDSAPIDRTRTEELSLGGVPYIFSSPILPADAGAVVLRCTPEVCAIWSDAALGGNFTLDSRGDAKVAWLTPNAENAYAVYTAIGGYFLTGSADGQVPISYTDFSEKTTAVGDLLDDILGEDAPFTLAHLFDLTASDGFLPLPKRSATDSYRTYINFSGTPLCAIPKNLELTESKILLIRRFAHLSEIYLYAPRREEITGGDPTRESLYTLIADSAHADLSDLYGYGDIPALIADIASGSEPQPAFQFYKRTTLYEKALSILEKRASDRK